MRGHAPLIAMRMSGKRPGIVFLNDYPCDVNWHKDREAAVTVCTHGDQLNTVDLRFLFGLTVSISSTVEQRARQIFEMAKASGAAVVAACHVQPDRHVLSQSGWVEVWRNNEANHGGCV